MKNLLYLALLVSINLSAQNLSLNQTKADLVQLKNEIQLYNPALDAYNPNFENSVNQLLTKLGSDSVSLIESFKYASQICALSNEGHFALGNWSDPVHSGFLENTYKYLPVSIKIRQDKMFVWIDNSAERALNRGDEILAINGMNAKTILSSLHNAFPTDGEITTYANRTIELGFSWMYYLYVAQPDSFHLKVKDSLGVVNRLTIKALSRDSQFENYAKYYPDKSKNAKPEIQVFHRLVHEGDVSYLTLPSFDYKRIERHGVKSKELYDAVFTTLKDRQTKYLVVDLRGNTGGRNEFADDMVKYINHQSNSSPFLKKTISWKGKEKTYKNPKSSKLAFQGKVYVLVDGRTYSAGSTLARYLNEYANAAVIGEETGTRYEGFAAGSKQYITLANSQFRIGIPRYHIVFPKSNKQSTSNRGLLPDHTIEYAIEDFIEGKDLHMDKVNSLIKVDKAINNKN